ncbi:hypothetical protein IWQ60_004775 [Tieghemiomyces parasiticus]|uniref:Uncharacterized protein n=1 Tax=Tieghemiomyces parasiticus TaxID=78921 RepID=A0A9W8DYU9_9FUNG|nr:hypothetical protein IWQ60_004775 [Tieghemiomyces parasiticus]
MNASGPQPAVETTLYDAYRCTDSKGYSAPNPYFLQPIKVHPQSSSSGQSFPLATKPYKAIVKDTDRLARNQPSAKFTLKRFGAGNESKFEASRVTSATNSPTSLRPTSPSVMGSPTSTFRGTSTYGGGGPGNGAPSVIGSVANYHHQRYAVHPPASKYDLGIDIRIDTSQTTVLGKKD